MTQNTRIPPESPDERCEILCGVGRIDAVMEGGIVARGERSRNPAFTEGDVADLCVVAG